MFGLQGCNIFCSLRVLMIFFSFFLLFSLSHLFLSLKKILFPFIVCVFHVGSLPQVSYPWLILIFYVRAYCVG